jgi:single-strand DNA-binding protein
MSQQDINKVMLIGRVGSDVSYMENNGHSFAYTNFVTNKSYKREGDSEWQSKATWHHLVFWGPLSKMAHQHITKGRRLYVEGELNNHKWVNKDGKECSQMQMIVKDVTFLDKKKAEETAPVPDGLADAPTEGQNAAWN